MMKDFKLIMKEFSLMEYYHSLDRRYKVILLSSFVWGLIAHGMVSFNHFFYHDDISSLFWRADLIPQGRWMFNVLTIIQNMVFGVPEIINPTLNFFIHFFILSIVVYAIAKFLEIENLFLCILMTGIFCVHPSVTTLFGYMSAIPYFSLSLLFAVTGGVFCCNNKPIISVIGIFLIVFSLGIYQAYFPFVISVLLLSIIKLLIDSPSINSKIVFKKVLYCIFIVCISAIIYFVLVKVSLVLTHQQLSDYKGANSYSLNITEYIQRIPVVYEKLLIGDSKVSVPIRFQIFPIVSFVIIYAFIICRKVYVVSKLNGLVLSALFVLMPFAINIIYFLCPEEIVYSMMLYGYVFIFIVLIWFIGLFSFHNNILHKCLRYSSSIIIFLILFAYIRLDNTCYMKANFMQHQTISYLTTLVTRIKSVEDYSTDKKVVFINPWNINDTSLKSIPYLSNFDIAPYWDIDKYVNDYKWVRYMHYWCGYKPEIADKKIFENMQEVKLMPSYPDDGSIKIINNTIVVKLGNKSVRSYDFLY